MAIASKHGAIDNYNHRRWEQTVTLMAELFELNRPSLCKYCKYNKVCYYCHYPSNAYNYVCDNVSFMKFRDEFISVNFWTDYRDGAVDENYDPLRDVEPNSEEWERLCKIWDRIIKPEFKGRSPK